MYLKFLNFCSSMHELNATSFGSVLNMISVAFC